MWDAEIRKKKPTARFIPNGFPDKLITGQHSDIFFADQQAPVTIIPTYPDLPMEDVYPRTKDTDMRGVFLRKIGEGKLIASAAQETSARYKLCEIPTRGGG